MSTFFKKNKREWSRWNFAATRHVNLPTFVPQKHEINGMRIYGMLSPGVNP